MKGEGVETGRAAPETLSDNRQEWRRDSPDHERPQRGAAAKAEVVRKSASRKRVRVQVPSSAPASLLPRWDRSITEWQMISSHRCGSCSAGWRRAHTTNGDRSDIVTVRHNRPMCMFKLHAVSAAAHALRCIGQRMNQTLPALSAELINQHEQQRTIAASAIAESKTTGHLS